MNGEFEIGELLPTGHRNLWKAKAQLSFDDEVDGLAVRQTIEFTVRISQSDTASVESLLQTVYDQARKTLDDAAAFLAANTLPALREAQRQSIEAETARFDPEP